MAMQNSLVNTDGIKVIITKKSGPGELIGEIEQTIKDGYVDFNGLQFDTAGDYVITLTPQSDLIEVIDIVLKVQPEEEIIPQEKSRDVQTEPEKVEGTRPIIAQIEKPTIKLSPIEFKATNSNSANNEIATGLGFTPFFWYNGYQINARDIKSLDLWYEGIVPNASIVFADSIGFMKKEGFPLDDTKFEIFLNSGSKNLKSIHLKFKLIKFNENKNNSYRVTGTIDLKDFYKIKFQSFKGTSFEVLKQVSKDLELGYNSNITNTSDSMSWLNNGKTYKDFVLDIMDHSYISDTSYVLGYIDYYYCLNYVDIEKEWLRDISKDVGLNSTGINYISSTEQQERVELLHLSNDKSNISSPFYFGSYKLNNQSTKLSLSKGYYTTSKVYDSETKQFLVFDVDSQTSDGSKTIILKGAPGDNSDIQDNFRTKYSGKMDSENVHKQYYYSETQNRVNLDNMVRISVDLELPNANFNLYKFMKIQINFVNDKTTITNDEVASSRLTGEWVVIDISYKWSKGNLKQIVRAVKKELGKTPDEINKDSTSQTDKKPETNTQNNDNPSPVSSDEANPPIRVSLTPPNSLYRIGETYLVQNKSGKQFRLTITEIMDNGKDVKGEVKNIE